MDKIINKLAKWINKHVKLFPPDEEKKYLRLWTPTCKEKLYAYFSVLIYIGIIIKSTIEDY
jgi:hypothetical protein